MNTNSFQYPVNLINNVFDYLTEKFPNEIVGLFPFGSSVYLNKTPDDYDFIVITNNKKIEQYSFLLNNLECQFSFYTSQEFKQGIINCDIHFFECINLKKSLFFLDPSLIDFLYFNNNDFKRTSVSQQSSNSYVKAKKKLIIDSDYDEIGSLKSLWHSLRMIDFSFQIATSGCIYDFQSTNNLYLDIRSDYDTISDYDNINDFWAFIHKKYKPVHNKYMSSLRTVTIKETK